MKRIQGILLLLAAVGLAGMIVACNIVPQSSESDGALSRAATAVTFEAESQSWSTSSGDSVSASSSTLRLNASASGDTFTFNGSVQAGTYSVSVKYAKRNIYGNFQLNVGGTNVGSALAGYSSDSSDVWTTATVGTVTVAGGSTAIKFTSTGKDSSASDYDFKIDYIAFAPSGSSTTTPTKTPTGGATTTPTKTPTPGPTATAGGTITITSTIVIPANTTRDYGNARIVAVGMGDGSQDEGQDPIFRLEKGAVLKNVRIAAPGCDGIHLYGGNTLQNVVWEDIGEDAMTIKGSSGVSDTFQVINCTASKGADKCFQVNATGTLKIINSKISDVGKVVRQNGGTTFEVRVYLENSTIVDGGEAIFRTDSSSSKLYLHGNSISGVEELFMSPNQSNLFYY